MQGLPVSETQKESPNMPEAPGQELVPRAPRSGGGPAFGLLLACVGAAFFGPFWVGILASLLEVSSMGAAITELFDTIPHFGGYAQAWIGLSMFVCGSFGLLLPQFGLWVRERARSSAASKRPRLSQSLSLILASQLFALALLPSLLLARELLSEQHAVGQAMVDAFMGAGVAGVALCAFNVAQNLRGKPSLGLSLMPGLFWFCLCVSWIALFFSKGYSGS